MLPTFRTRRRAALTVATTISASIVLAGCTVSPDGKQLVGVGRGGQIWASTGSNAEWVPAGVTHGSAQALATTNDGDILVFDDSGLAAIAK
ncbi:hypothetical protein [uncultured Microbacterium sp.]|uniref:hypothetical protein n=1 Tax=uncultured Microbacterium sp. TaxID=191216 RepID=UPI0028ECAC23|nr:hypothetical protein [uncultured Microbacterium sp.]